MHICWFSFSTQPGQGVGGRKNNSKFTDPNHPISDSAYFTQPCLTLPKHREEGRQECLWRSSKVAGSKLALTPLTWVSVAGTSHARLDLMQRRSSFEDDSPCAVSLRSKHQPFNWGFRKRWEFRYLTVWFVYLSDLSLVPNLPSKIDIIFSAIQCHLADATLNVPKKYPTFNGKFGTLN